MTLNGVMTADARNLCRGELLVLVAVNHPLDRNTS